MVNGIYAGALDPSLNMFSRQINSILDDAQKFANNVIGPPVESWGSSWFTSRHDYNSYGYHHHHHHHYWWHEPYGYGSSSRSSSSKDKDDALIKVVGLLLLVGGAVTSYFASVDWGRWGDASVELSHAKHRHRVVWRCEDSFGHSDVLKRICSTQQNVLWRRKFSAQLGLILKLGLAAGMFVTGYGMLSNQVVLARTAGKVLGWVAGAAVFKLIYEKFAGYETRAAQQIQRDVALLRNSPVKQVLARYGLLTPAPVE